MELAGKLCEIGKLERGLHNLCVLDEPATGLRFAELDRLRLRFDRLVGNKHSVVAIERDLDVLETADHVIELGP